MTLDLSALCSLVWANVETRCYGVHCFALPATVWLCPTDFASLYRFGLRALDSVLDEGSSHLKSENKLLKVGAGPRRKRHLWMERAQDKRRGQWPVPPQETRENHGGNVKYPLTHPPSHLEQSLSFLTLPSASNPKIQTHPLPPHPALNLDGLSSSTGPNQHPVSMETAVHIPNSSGNFWTQDRTISCK